MQILTKKLQEFSANYNFKDNSRDQICNFAALKPYQNEHKTYRHRKNR